MFVRLLLVLLVLATPSLQFWLPSFPWDNSEDNNTEIRVLEDRENMLTTLDHLEAIGEDAVDTTNQLISQVAEGAGHLIEANADIVADITDYVWTTANNHFDFLTSAAGEAGALATDTLSNTVDLITNIFNHKVEAIEAGVEDGVEAVEILVNQDHQ